MMSSQAAQAHLKIMDPALAQQQKVLMAPAPPPGSISPMNLGSALAAGAAAAENKCERTDDESMLKMSTRRFIDSQLQAHLAKAIKLLHKERPGPEELQEFLLQALDGKTPVSTKPPSEELKDARVYDYLKSSGALLLLKPALLAVDRHRPKDPKAFIAEFLSSAVKSLH
jgi:hypothetical protein